MVFSSYEFVLFFLPITYIVFTRLRGGLGAHAPLLWLIAASLVFYGWWNPVNLVVILASVLFNFSLGKTIFASRGTSRAKALLALGVAVNLGFLGYFKYGAFSATVVNDLLGTSFAWARVALPLGISFFTFQQIAYLADSMTGRAVRSSLLEYVLFVTFFAHVSSGPIVHHKEFVPQLGELPKAASRSDLEVGLVLFAIGMVKKLLVADSLSIIVDPTFATARSADVSLLQAWTAALGFMLQVYFDFSGYSDMALGVGRMFGLRLPVNFNSPLKATNIITFWSRFHVSLTQFLTAYIFNPISMAAMRRALRTLPRGERIGRGSARFHGFATILVVPTLLTMFLAGVWHGAGYQFLVFGLLHGGYLVANHTWRRVMPVELQKRATYVAVTRPLGLLLTLAAVSFAVIFFRADSLGTAMRIAGAALGANGLSIPEGIWVEIAVLQPMLGALGVTPDSTAGSLLVGAVLMCSAALAITLLSPNSLDMTRDYDPATGYAYVEQSDEVMPHVGRYRFRADGWGGLFLGVLGAIGFLCLGRVSVFLYWQF